MQRIARMKRELQNFSESPPFGISCWSKGDSIENLEAQILGPGDSPFEGGVFKLEIQIPERYPFEPPKVKFETPVYHPNIDNAGRICLDSLKMPPKGAWKPSLNVSTTLTSIHLLMSEPNPDDPLMTDIANEFKYNRPLYTQRAKECTKKYAQQTTKDQENDSSSANQIKNSIQKSQECSDSSSDSSDEECQNTEKEKTISKKRLSDVQLENSAKKIKN